MWALAFITDAVVYKRHIRISYMYGLSWARFGELGPVSAIWGGFWRFDLTQVAIGIPLPHSVPQGRRLPPAVLLLGFCVWCTAAAVLALSRGAGIRTQIGQRPRCGAGLLAARVGPSEPGR